MTRKTRPLPPRPDRLRRIRGSFSWIDHRFLREGFDQGLTRLEKLLYLVLIAVSNQDGVSFYSDRRLGELLDIRYPHELTGARDELVARDLIAFQEGLYQVLELPARPSPPGHYPSAVKPSASGLPPPRAGSRREDARCRYTAPSAEWKSLRQVLGLEEAEDEES